MLPRFPTSSPLGGQAAQRAGLILMVDEPCKCEKCARIYSRVAKPRALGTLSRSLIAFVVSAPGACLDQITRWVYGARGDDPTVRLGTSREDRVRCTALLAALVYGRRLERVGVGQYVAGEPREETITERLVDHLASFPGASVEDLARAGYPELMTLGAREGRIARIRTVAILGKLVDRGQLARIAPGHYALPPAGTAVE